MRYHFLAYFSLVIFGVSLVMWFRSAREGDYVEIDLGRRYTSIASFRESLYLCSHLSNRDRNSFNYISQWPIGERSFLPEINDARPNAWGFSYFENIGVPIKSDVRVVGIPYWGIAVVSGLGCIFGFVRRGHKLRPVRSREERGLCKECGFDLRMHKVGEKCPECGAVVRVLVVATTQHIELNGTTNVQLTHSVAAIGKEVVIPINVRVFDIYTNAGIDKVTLDMDWQGAKPAGGAFLTGDTTVADGSATLKVRYDDLALPGFYTVKVFGHGVRDFYFQIHITI